MTTSHGYVAGRCCEENANRCGFSPLTCWQTLEADAPRRVYYQRKGEARSTNHWGQRKLLLSEIEFLTQYGNMSDTVVYAGAVSTCHTMCAVSAVLRACVMIVRGFVRHQA